MKITLHNRTPPVSIDCEGYAGLKMFDCESGDCSVEIIAEYKTGRRMRYNSRELLQQNITCFKFAEEITSIVFELTNKINEVVVKFDVELIPENNQLPPDCNGII